jgi:hypothetical protein
VNNLGTISCLIDAQRAFLVFMFAMCSLCVAEPDSWKNGCQQSEACAIRGATREDRYAEINMASSDLQSIKTKNKMEKSLELSGEKKGSEEVPGTLIKDDKKVPLKLGLLSRVRTTSSVAEQEVHSGFDGVEVSISHMNIAYD